MHIFLGADHRGYKLRTDIVNWLNTLQIPYTDFGAEEYDAEDDYNDYAKKVAQALLSSDDPESYGVLLCGSGQGMCMQANRYKGIRAALCATSSEAIETRGHNNANILCISADNVQDHLFEILDSFLDTKPLPDEKYQRRCRKLDEE